MLNFRKTLTSILILIFFGSVSLTAQNYWQQRADYEMEIDFDVKKHKFKGDQKITYTNNSPDTLVNLYYHLYLNAFQPGSMMDTRSLWLPDPDPRVQDRISKLKKKEYGSQKVLSFKLDGKDQPFKIEETILEIDLKNPILPGQTVVLEMEFETQVPKQIRRTGRNNKEGIDYSMSQWYPKLSEYDFKGWNPNPYIAREFHGIWGDWDVKIKIDKDYIVAGTGVLQNAEEIGYGYADVEIKKRPKKHTWHFKAENVHDFVWAADPDYKHTKIKAYNGTMIHFFYQPNDKTNENWETLPKAMDAALKFMNENFGEYPYSTYSFIQGGDGGMEYPMATLITGERTLGSLIGVSIHEWMHSWYQMVLATNEALYPWMDEGFTSYGSAATMNHLKEIGVLPGEAVDNPYERTVNGFAKYATSGYEEPISTHADHFTRNQAYSVGSYTKGQLALVHLDYIMGHDKLPAALKKYYNTWKFKHPTPDDFFRVMEKESGMVLDWFQEYWVNTTHTIDYSIDTVLKDVVTLSRKGAFPMPVDLLVTRKDGKKELYYIPLGIMRGEKKPDVEHDMYFKQDDWYWTHTTYELKLNSKMSDIESIELEPSNRVSDVDRDNNIYPRPKTMTMKKTKE